MGIILSIFGWNDIDHDTYLTMEQHKKLVIVFPHTSYWDFFFYIGYFMRYNLIQTRARVLINPKFMTTWGWFVKMFGGMESTKREIHGGGRIEKIKKELSGMDEFMLMLSPKGSTLNHPWRTGYYNLAKELDCHLVTGGFNYETKEFVLKKPFKVDNMTLEEAEARCKSEMRDITPINIKNSEVPLNAHEREAYPSVIDPLHFIVLLTMIIIIIVLIVLLVVYIYRARRRNKETKSV